MSAPPRPAQRHFHGRFKLTVRGYRRKSAQKRYRVVISVCLFPDDLVKLKKLTRGRDRMRSAVIRHLIRRCEGIHEIDLAQTLTEDNILGPLHKHQYEDGGMPAWMKDSEV